MGKLSVVQWASRVREDIKENEGNIPMELKKVSIRLPEDTVALLDTVSTKLNMSRSALIEELVMRSLDEVAPVVGVSTDADGFYVPDEVAE